MSNVDDFSENSNIWAYPKRLHGDLPKVRRFWKKVTQKACEQRSWKGVLADLERASLLDDDTPIQVGLTRLYLARQSVIRIHIVHEELHERCSDLGKDVYRHMLLKLTEELWGALCVLYTNA